MAVPDFRRRPEDTRAQVTVRRDAHDGIRVVLQGRRAPLDRVAGGVRTEPRGVREAGSVPARSHTTRRSTRVLHARGKRARRTFSTPAFIRSASPTRIARRASARSRSDTAATSRRDRSATLRIGGDVTGYLVPANLKESYGSPWSFHVYLRYQRPGRLHVMTRSWIQFPTATCARVACWSACGIAVTSPASRLQRRMEDGRRAQWLGDAVRADHRDDLRHRTVVRSDPSRHHERQRSDGVGELRARPGAQAAWPSPSARDSSAPTGTASV